MQALFDVTGWKPFLLASILINVLIVISTYLSTSFFLYKLIKKFS
jgi:hypothetical protein